MKSMKIQIINLLLMVIGLFHDAYTDTFSIIMGKDQPISKQGFNNALKTASGIFKKQSGSIVHIRIPAGVHVLSSYSNQRLSSMKTAINLYGIHPGINGRLVIEGAGMNKTILVVDEHEVFVTGRSVEQLTIRNLTFKRNRPMAGQGTVVATGKGFVTVRMHDGFPGMKTLIDPGKSSGRYLRRYTYIANKSCEIQMSMNQQIPYKSYQHLGGRVWRLYLKNRRKRSNYAVGDVVGIKSKCCGSGGNVYWFCGGNDIVFENIRFMRASRGTLRCGISNIRFTNISIPKDRKDTCLSTSGGGPQLGQPYDAPIRNVTVENVVTENTGDDAIAFFNVETGVIRNCDVRDSFARGILLFKSPYVKLFNNTLVRCKVTRIQ